MGIGSNLHKIEQNSVEVHNISLANVGHTALLLIMKPTCGKRGTISIVASCIVTISTSLLLEK